MKRALNGNDIFIHNDYFDEVQENLDNYDLNEIFDLACESFVHRKVFLNYMFKKLIKMGYNEVMLLKTNLISCDLYDEFVNNIVNGNDNNLKAILVIYFEENLKDELFKDNKEIINTVASSEDNEFTKLTNLINISRFRFDKESYDYLKSTIRNILFEHNSEESDENNNKILNTYYQVMDSNQYELGNLKLFKKEN